MICWVLLILISTGSVMTYQNVSNPKLGVENGHFKPLSGKPNGVSSQAENASKKVAVIPYKGDMAKQMQSVEKVVAAMPGAKIEQIEGPYLYAVFTSSLMRFKDDVEVYLDDAKKEINFRSASRVGYSDMGVNRKRYNAFAMKLESTK